MTCWNPTTPADRARTILAMGGPAHWRLDPAEEVLVAPFIAHGATPLLLVDHDDLEELHDQHRLTVSLRPSSRLGALVLSGRPRVPTPEEYAGELGRYRSEHADCGPACGADRIPVAVELVDVALSGPSDTRFDPLALSDLHAGVAQESFLAAYAIAHHLNSAHTEDLIRYAAGLAHLAPESIVAAHVAEITADGLLLTVIDDAGATPLDIGFGRPVGSVAELGEQLHRLLTRASLHPRD